MLHWSRAASCRCTKAFSPICFAGYYCLKEVFLSNRRREQMSQSAHSFPSQTSPSFLQLPSPGFLAHISPVSSLQNITAKQSCLALLGLCFMCLSFKLKTLSLHRALFSRLVPCLPPMAPAVEHHCFPQPKHLWGVFYCIPGMPCPFHQP